MLGSHRDQAQFTRAKWRRRILLPCWLIQIPILLTQIGIFSYRLSNTIHTYQGAGAPGDVPTVELVWEITNIAFSAISFIIDMLQIARFLAEALTPFSMLSGNIIGVVFSIAILSLDIVVYVRVTDRYYSSAALGLDCALLLFTLIPAVYGAIVYRRSIAYDEYHHPHNVKHYGFAKEQQETSYDPSRLNSATDPEMMYDPTAHAPDARPRRPSFTLRRFSSNGFVEDRLSVSPHPRPEAERRTSYDHKRDTQFDDYVARQTSLGKESAGRVFGRNDGKHQYDDDADGSVSSRSSSSSSSHKRHGAEVDGSIVTSGTVPVSTARPRGDSLQRMASWEINLGTASPDGLQRGHSLVSVPEADEEEIVGGRRRGSEDRQALLGLDRRISGQSFASRDSRMEPVETLDVLALDSKKRTRAS